MYLQWSGRINQHWPPWSQKTKEIRELGERGICCLLLQHCKFKPSFIITVKLLNTHSPGLIAHLRPYPCAVIAPFQSSETYDKED